MSSKDLDRLNKADRLIQKIAKELGLDFMPQEFDVVPAQKMLEIMAYRLPVNFSHWSFGRNYELERTKYEHGYSVPYEVVFNSEPCRAYLMETNPFPIQVLVMAHVYAHNDFMKNNRHFQDSRRDMITSASEAANRFRRYEEDYGREAVEKLIDAGMAIQWNIDPDASSHPESEQEARERLYGFRKSPPVQGRFSDLLPGKEEITPQKKKALRKKTPPEPTMDLLGYISEHSPRNLQEWEKDVLSVIRGQAQYFIPYRRTKIMNEGWATYWHEKIMQRLFAEGFLDAEEHGYYNLYNARVKAHQPRDINPYLLGYTLFSNVEDRWDKGRFGPAYEEVESAQAKQEWDQGLMEGRKKILQVRRTHMDWFFLDEFLNQEVIEALELYLYLERERDTHYDVVVEEVDWQKVKRILVQSQMNWGIPRVLVMNGNYQESLQLYLKHAFEGLPLDEEYCRKTLEHIHYLWERPVHLETVVYQNRKPSTKRYLADEKGIHIHLE